MGCCLVSVNNSSCLFISKTVNLHIEANLKSTFIYNVKSLSTKTNRYFLYKQGHSTSSGSVTRDHI